MNLDVWIKKNKVYVNCRIHCESSTFSFRLAKSLTLHTTDHYTCRDIKVPFQPDLIEYTFQNVTSPLQFSYEGSLEGYFCYFTDAVIHFSFYNAWYPMVVNQKETYNILIHGFQNYVCVEGVYDSKIGGWIYHGNKMEDLIDCNVLLVKKDKCYIYESECLNLISVYQKNNTILSLIKAYEQIYSYYCDLYGKDRLGKHWLVFLQPPTDGEGAYKRNHLIVYGCLPKNVRDAVYLLAHEMGHSYAFGADANTWQDWLNETHAEWSAMTYWYDADRVYFKERLDLLLDDKPLNLNPSQGKRPDDVHKTGSRLYARIYQKYGIDEIKLLLKTFDQLHIKDTEHFLKAIPKDIAEMIQNYL